MMFSQKLPSTSTNSHRRFFPSALVLVLVLSIFVTLSLFYDFRAITTGIDWQPVQENVTVVPPPDLDYPPGYKELRKRIHDLPQHNLSLPFPEGKDGRYVKFSCQIQQLGWNNVLNELLMNNHLAYKSNRAYVFSDYVWKREYYPWPMEKAIEWPPRTPLLALISGPTAGDPWPANDPAPRSVSSEWFDIVCPREKRKIINTREYKPQLTDAGGREIFDTWKRALDGPEPCIEIESETREVDPFPQVFDLWVWGSGRLIEIWDEFKASPVSQSLGASSIVENAVKVNTHVFHASPKEVGVVDPYSRMLAIHLRRGDYKDACKSLSDYNSTYYSWNLFDFLPDKFTPPSGGIMGKNTPENEAQYMNHCLPTDDQILQKIRDSRSDYLRAAREEGREETVDVLYMLTNDNSEWVSEVKKTMKNDGWRVVATSRELTLTMEGKDVGMAVDMEIARKAAVFIGNGWSSFTSNILHRRLLDGRIPMSNRFY